jgi:hypothetical protein
MDKLILRGVGLTAMQAYGFMDLTHAKFVTPRRRETNSKEGG